MQESKRANECMNGELGKEEIEEAMKEMKESALGEDGIRMCYLKEALGGERCSDKFER